MADNQGRALNVQNGTFVLSKRNLLLASCKWYRLVVNFDNSMSKTECPESPNILFKEK